MKKCGVSTFICKPFDRMMKRFCKSSSSDHLCDVNNSSDDQSNPHRMMSQSRDYTSHLKLNIFNLKLSPKPSSRRSSRDELKESGNKSPRSPFSIRIVRQVKPERLFVNDKSIKKKTRKKLTSAADSSMNQQSSESRMVIKRERARSSSTNPATNQRPISMSDPRNADVYERLLRKKHSVSEHPFLPEDTHSDDSDNEIERRRRRFRKLQTSPKFSTVSRSLSIATQEVLAKKVNEDFNNNKNEEFNTPSKKSDDLIRTSPGKNVRNPSTSQVKEIANRITNPKSKKVTDRFSAPVKVMKQSVTNGLAKQDLNVISSKSETIHRSSNVINDRSSSQESRSEREKRKEWTKHRATSFTDPLLGHQSDKSDSESEMNRGAKKKNKQTSHQKKKHQGEKAKNKDDNESSNNDINNKVEEYRDTTTKSDSKNILQLTVDISARDQNDTKMDLNSYGSKPKRSQSLRDKCNSGSKQEFQRKISHQPRKASYDLNDSLPDLIDTPKTPNNSADRLKRDYHLTNVEIMALRGILRKADLYEETVRDRMFQILKIEESREDDLERIVSQVIAEKEIESLKQKLFMSRKELDSYISFTKRMEREKRQSISEKEEMETKIQWHERRLTRFESENKSLKTERATLLNQIYELKGKSNQSGHNRQKSLDSNLVSLQPELELSKQRLIYEADAFAQERTKLIKERQRLDEEVRKVQIRCVSLLAQLQHSEKTVEELQQEKEQLKSKLAKQAKQSHEDVMKLQTRLADAEDALSQATDESGDRQRHRKDYSSFIETMRQDESEFTSLQCEFAELERKYDELQNEYRNTKENRIRLEHENMALKDTVNVIQSAKEDALVRLNDLDSTYRETLGELKAITVASEDFENERRHLREELEEVSCRLSELQHEAVEMEADQDSFRKFLDKLTMELKERLGDEHEISEGDTLEERADLISKQIASHLTPSRKLQEDFQALKEEKDDLEEEIRYLKFALANRLEIKNLQTVPNQNGESSKETNTLKADLDDAIARIGSLEAEVNRLHQDKQQLLMSFLNLQASQRSRDVSKSDVGMTTDDDLSDDDSNEDTETERESDADSRSYNSSNPSIASASKNVVASSPRCRQPPNVEDEIKELRSRLESEIRTRETLERERVDMLDSLCRQVDINNVIQAELESLKGNSSSPPRPNSRPGSSISKSDSSNSLSQDKCPNCSTYSDEIRSYLSIIEELTEDKLRLEKNANDLEVDREHLKSDVERLTESNFKIKSELADVGNANDSALKSAKAESQFLFQNIQSLENENSVLEENLRKLREDKTEILDNLRQAEEDRYGFIRTMHLLTEQKDVAESEIKGLKEEVKELKKILGERAIACPTSYPNLSKDEEVVMENDAGDKSKTVVTRSYSSPALQHRQQNAEDIHRSISDALESPHEHPLHRVKSIEDVSENVLDFGQLQSELCYLRDQVQSYQRENVKLQRSLDLASGLVNDEKKRSVAETTDLESSDVVTTLEHEMSDTDKRRSWSRDRGRVGSSGSVGSIEYRRRGTLDRKSSVVLDDDATPHQRLYQRKTSIDVLFDNDERTIPESCASPKTFSFQVSCNGVPVHEQN